MTTIAELIDEFVATKNKREELQNEVKGCTEKMGRIEADIMELMSQAGINQAASEKASCTMRQAQHPVIEDWQVFYDYVAQTKQFELLHKRLSSPAFRERWEAGDPVPGSSMSKVWELSVRRK
jgi:hypothetical protein